MSPTSRNLPSLKQLHEMVLLPGDNETHITNLERAYATALAAIERLEKVEHAAWHLLDDSEHRMDNGEVVVLKSAFDDLSDLLPAEHPGSEEVPAPSENRTPLATAERIVQLEKALQQCVSVAKAWHGDDAFDIYYNHSPEMKLIRDAIGMMPDPTEA